MIFLFPRWDVLIPWWVKLWDFCSVVVDQLSDVFVISDVDWSEAEGIQHPDISGSLEVFLVKELHGKSMRLLFSFSQPAARHGMK